VVEVSEHVEPTSDPVSQSMIPKHLRPVIAETKELAERFESAGYSVYLVGGPVRDAIAGRPGGADVDARQADIDLTTDALPDTIEHLIAGWASSTWLQGKRFGTIGAAKSGRRFEITTHRAEAYSADSRKPDVEFGRDIVVDLSRRDFTINAMALRLPDLKLFDPFDGIDDLANRRLRTPLDPTDSFTDDPLRMLRAARFIAGYQLTPDPSLVSSIEQIHGRLEIVSAERIRDEFDKLMILPDPSAGLWFLVNTGVAQEFIPELLALSLEQDPIHRHKDVLAHTIAVVGKTRPERILRLAALFHDVGKPRTRAFGPNGVSFHHHDVVGARMTRQRMQALRYSSDDIASVSKLVELHLRFHTYAMGWTDSALRRYARDAGDLVWLLNELTRADCTTRNERRVKELEARMDELEVRLAELNERETLSAIRPELDGDQVMALLDLRPSRAVGEALEFLLEIRLEEGLIGGDVAKERLLAWWKARDST
jgi:poly(A) polymerase